METEEQKNEILDFTWFFNYLKTKGPRIVIPKEAKQIKDLSDAICEYRELLDKQGKQELDEGIELYFEDGSELETIGMRTFLGVKCKNKVVFPKTLKRIHYYSFVDSQIEVELQEGTELEICRDAYVLKKGETIDIPPSLKSVWIHNAKDLKSVSLPKESRLEELEIKQSDQFNEIQTPNGTIRINSAKPVKSVFCEQNGNSILVTYTIFDDEEKIDKKYLIVWDNVECKEVYRGEMSIRSSLENKNNGFMLKFDNIWQCDVEKLRNVPFDVKIELEKDHIFNGIKEKRYSNGIDVGRNYTIDEIQQIQEKLKNMASKINFPPEVVKNREKIIYAQMVRVLLDEGISYDQEVAMLIYENKKNSNITFDEATNAKIQQTHTLKGLLNGKTVCAGYARIIEAFSDLIQLKCSVITSDTHGWNLVELDGEIYEDDFTFYKNKLGVSDIPNIHTFLRGLDINGDRQMGEIASHKTNAVLLELSGGISQNQLFNLLTINWAQVQNWKSINLESERLYKQEDFKQQMRSLVTKGADMWRRAKETFFNGGINGISSFFRRIHRIGHLRKEVYKDDNNRE